MAHEEPCCRVPGEPDRAISRGSGASEALGAPCPCPACGKVGRRVSGLTVANHVPEGLRRGLGEHVSFCLNPACDVVYCAPGGRVVRRGETRLPVTIKDSGDDVPVCYCFGFKRGDLREGSDIPERIRRGVKEGRCDCERKNPQGSCCLGNVGAEMRKTFT